MKPEKDMRVVRSVATNFETREDSGEPTIEGYFAVFDSNYQIDKGLTESIDRHAFDSTLSGDIRALTDHDTSKVLGRTTNGTLELKTDDHGLWGKVRINPKDTEAMNLYERVKRGDVSQCSFGFEITSEETEVFESGDVHWTITGVNLFEVSAVTFPAYTATSISARSKDVEEIRKRQSEAWKKRMLEKLKGAKDGITSIDVEKETRRKAFCSC